MADKEGMKRLAPGVYADTAGTLHVDAVELCEAAGYEATPENIATLEAAARNAAAQAGATFATVETAGRRSK